MLKKSITELDRIVLTLAYVLRFRRWTRRRIPRPLAPDQGIDLGVPQPLPMDIGHVRESSDTGESETPDYSGPRSRRGGRLDRGRGRRGEKVGSKRKREGGGV